MNMKVKDLKVGDIVYKVFLNQTTRLAEVHKYKVLAKYKSDGTFYAILENTKTLRHESYAEEKSIYSLEEFSQNENEAKKVALSCLKDRIEENKKYLKELQDTYDLFSKKFKDIP